MKTKRNIFLYEEHREGALKICPFCGVEPVMVHTNLGYNVSCYAKNCNIHPHTSFFEKWKDAIEAWNRREGEIDERT